MANEIRLKYGSEATAQASAAITADAFSGGAQTAINNATTGASAYMVFANISSAPGAAATLEVHVEASPDGTNYAVSEFALSVPVASGYSGRVCVGVLHDPPRSFKLKAKAIANGLTCDVTVVPMLPEVQ